MDKNKSINICRDDDIDPMAVISAINEGIVILKEENIIYANQAFSSTAGKDLSDILGTSFADLVSEKARETM
jgi:PAS domain-containing protein